MFSILYQDAISKIQSINDLWSILPGMLFPDPCEAFNTDSFQVFRDLAETPGWHILSSYSVHSLEYMLFCYSFFYAWPSLLQHGAKNNDSEELLNRYKKSIFHFLNLWTGEKNRGWFSIWAKHQGKADL